VTEDLQRQLHDTGRRLRELDDRVDDLDTEHQRLKSKLGYTDDLDSELRGIRSDVSDCETRIGDLEEELGGRLGAAETAIERLTQHVRLLEGQIMTAGGTPAADLDTFTKDQRALARTMQRGWAARSLLLRHHERLTHQTRVQHHRQTTDKHRAARGLAIDAVGALTGTRYGTADHTEAATRLRTAIAEETRLRQDLARQATDAEKSAAALAADAATRSDKQPVTEAGDRAEKRLTLALRSRLADAVSSRSVLPVWFVTVLGAAPPARAADRWLETATRVLLYRLALFTSRDGGCTRVWEAPRSTVG
jgi:chromosome segregation ATPase